ncbi:YtzC family protein [Falsibacillus pallidus]|uniref:Uncharacterized protein DUF2524 n=1 Tax=Falsibacillus pallidus TaxID=493781 RepID=A0A370GKU7_9BACI|nr:YtzC family protein [Falsibacillus pallidus]RDI44345.1 uncharacterized protein DUF2524 [Falsibacillus pallidus]
MTTRDSMDQFMQQCEDTIRNAQEHMVSGSKQGHYHDVEYSEAMGQLESAYNELTHLAQSANAQQREMLHRKRLQLQQLQNQMILLNHDR